MALLKLAKSVTAEELKNLKPMYQGLYVKQADGSFELDGDMHESLDTTGLNSALDKERKGHAEAQKRLKALEKLGLTEEEFAAYAKLGKPGELEQKLQQATKGTEGAVKDLERRIADIQQGHQKELAEAAKRELAMKASLEKYLVNDRVTTALTDAKGKPKLLLPHVVSRTKVVQNEKGEYEVRVIDDNGDFRGDGKGGWMTVGGLIDEMKKDKDFQSAFEPTGAGGSGTKPGQKTGTGNVGGDLSPGDLIGQGLAQLRG